MPSLQEEEVAGLGGDDGDDRGQTGRGDERGVDTEGRGSSAAATWWTSSEELKTLVSPAHGNTSVCTEEPGILQKEHRTQTTPVSTGGSHA